MGSVIDEISVLPQNGFRKPRVVSFQGLTVRAVQKKRNACQGMPNCALQKMNVSERHSFLLSAKVV